MSLQALAQALQALGQQLAIFEKQLVSQPAEKERVPGQLTTSDLPCLELTRNLSFGSRGDDVAALQLFLTATGDLNGAEAGGFFDLDTQSAVQSFQRREEIVTGGNPITSGYGAVGPLTRGRIQALGCGTDDSNAVPLAPCRAGDAFNSATGEPCSVASVSTPPPAETAARGVKLRTIDQATGGGLTGVAITIRRGSTYVATQTTGSDGYTPGIQLNIGESHTFSFSKSGYQNRPAISVVIPAGADAYTYGPVALVAETTAASATAYTLSTSIAGTGSGTITKNPNQTSYAPGAFVTITANPAGGSTFAGWGGSYGGTVNPKLISMNSNVTAIANFTAAASSVQPQQPTPPPPPAPATITVTSPAANTVWAADQGHTVIWSTIGVGGSNSVTIELLTPSNGSVPGFNAFTTANDYSESMSLASVAPGWYYFRLKATVNGQIIYGGSGVFQLVASLTTTSPPPPPAPATITVTAPTASSVWSSAHSIVWTSVNVPASNLITIELLTPSNGSTGRDATTVNDGSHFVDVSTVTPGWYYWRLKTTINGQPVYGGSPVFKID